MVSVIVLDFIGGEELGMAMGQGGGGDCLLRFHPANKLSCSAVDIDKDKKQEELVRNDDLTTGSGSGTSMEEKKASDANDEGYISRSDDETDSYFSREDVSLQIHIPEEEMAWLHWSAVGKLKQPANIVTVQVVGYPIPHSVSIKTTATVEENLLVVAESERNSDIISVDVLNFDKRKNASGNEKISTDSSIELVHEKSMALENEEFNRDVGFQIEEELVLLSMEMNIVEKENDLQLAVLEENGNIEGGHASDFNIGLDVTNLENGPLDVANGSDNEELWGAYNSLNEERNEPSPILSEYLVNKTKGMGRRNRDIRIAEEHLVRNKVFEKRKKKRGRKGTMKLVYKDKFQEELNLDVSISDEEINHRNMVLLKEAEETFKISEMLGIKFRDSRDQIVQRLMDMEATE
ncbi:hypothetical protein CCACVL1_11081 [Corchorus capsularis]|uniref:Uncharacterized protein n=1 Tax=Corchorus capsularis TaxID=210143 RepID=A0A1R3IMW8_COCAP|nr:hypothetical protein CCACVL1_11081 [Corchorus capsularis]